MERLLGVYARGTRRSFPCEACGSDVSFPEWEMGEGATLAPLAVRFYNWTAGLLPSVRAQLEAIAGSRAVEILGRE